MFAQMDGARDTAKPAGDPRLPPFFALLCFLLLTGATACSPGRTLAGVMLRAPNTYPDWLAPPARVTLRLPKALLTNLPSERIEVGPPPARLWVGLVRPGDYQSRFVSTNRPCGSRREFSFSMRAVFPPQPLGGNHDAPTTAGALPAPGARPTTVGARGTVFLLHGYGVDSLSMLPWAVVVAEAGYEAVLVDLRGHGESTGRRIGFGTMEVGDLRQVLDHLVATHQAPGPVAVMGESLGAALALRWAASDSRLATVIAFAPYAELEPAIVGIRDDYAAWLPRAWVRSAARRLPDLLEVRPESLDTSAHVDGLMTPTLLVAAGHDGIAPPPAVGRLARLCAGPVKYVMLDGAQHENLPYHFSELRALVLEWLEAYCRSGHSSDR